MNPISRIKLVVFALSIVASLQAQEEQKNYPGKVSGKIYSNFNYSLNADDRSTAFELDRAYFGYEKQISEHFFANVKLDIGSPDDVSVYNKLRRYAYFKNAGLTYKNGKLTAWAGLFDMQQFKLQEKFWGYRYLYKTFMDAYRIGPSADLGTGISYAFSDKISSDLIISNGEGYSSPQRDETFKTGWGLTLVPIPELTLRTYYSVFTSEIPQMTVSGFIGYHGTNFRLAGEYIYQHNYQFNQNQNRYGYSVYSTYEFSEKWEIFLRYDQVYSNILGDATEPWNLADDGSALITGVQFSPIKNIRFSLDYQDWIEYAGNGAADRILYLHLEVNF